MTLNQDLAWAALACALGPFAGSFIGLLSLRLPRAEPWAISRSRCTGCSRTLGLPDLAPVLSFMATRGRCRTCGSPIPRRYPALELGCLTVALWAAGVHSGPAVLLTAVLGWWLLLLAVLDGEHFWLPDALTLPLAAMGLAANAFVSAERALESAVGAAVGFLTLAGVGWLYARLRGREGLGGGDARLLAAAGAWVGWTGLPSVLLWASIAGLSAVAGAALTGRRVAADTAVPFGVFLGLGLWLTWLYGPLGL